MLRHDISRTAPAAVARARCVEVLAIFFAVAAAYALVGVALFAPEYRRARLEVEFGAAFTTPQARPRSFVRWRDVARVSFVNGCGACRDDRSLVSSWWRVWQQHRHGPSRSNNDESSERASPTQAAKRCLGRRRCALARCLHRRRSARPPPPSGGARLLHSPTTARDVRGKQTVPRPPALLERSPPMAASVACVPTTHNAGGSWARASATDDGRSCSPTPVPRARACTTDLGPAGGASCVLARVLAAQRALLSR